MLMVDTSACIEWLISSPTGVMVERFIPDREAWLVPSIVKLELIKWLTCEAEEDKADQVIAFTQMCAVAPLDTKIAFMAAEICSRHKLPAADSIIYATALEYDAEVLTWDAHFDGLEGVKFVPKSLS